jgi:hypothetical protein
VESESEMNFLKKSHGTDFIGALYPRGGITTRRKEMRPCSLAGVWFSREEDRLHALDVCGIDEEFQRMCTKFKIGGVG